MSILYIEGEVVLLEGSSVQIRGVITGPNENRMEGTFSARVKAGQGGLKLNDQIQAVGYGVYGQPVNYIQIEIIEVQP